MKKNLKKANLFAFSILIFSGLFAFSLNNSDLNLNNSKTVQTHGSIIDFEAGEGFYGATIDTDLDGFADTLYMWGNNEDGQIGNGTSGNDVLIPTIIEPEGGWNGNIVDLSLGNYNSGVTIDTDSDGFADSIYIWGEDTYGQVGNNTNTYNVPTPTLVEDTSFLDGNFLDLNFGEGSTGILIDTDLDGFGDKIYMWGNNSKGQLGLSSDAALFDSPSLVNFPSGKIIDFDLGDDFSGAISDSDGDNKGDSLYMWGNNDHHQLGEADENITSETSPKLIDTNWNDNNLMTIKLEGRSSTLLSDSNDDNIADSLWAWGSNNYYLLPSDVYYTISEPTLSSEFDGDDGGIIDFALGSDHAGIIIDSNNDNVGDKVLTKGSNISGQLGTGGNSGEEDFEEISFEDVNNNPVNSNFIKLAFGDDTSGLLADLDNDGYNDTIYLWGSNSDGQFGNGSSGNEISTPYLAFSLLPLVLSSIDISLTNNETLSVTIILDDVSDIYNENNIPTIKLKDTEGDELSPIIDEANSDFAFDKYVYTLSEIAPGTEYDFNLLTIDDKAQFTIDEKIVTDYFINGVSLNKTTENTATFDLDLSLNNDFNSENYDDLQRQVSVNFSDNTSFETVINANNQIVIDELDPAKTYTITNIDYNFDENSGEYKYNILTPNLVFKTTGFDIALEANTFTIDNASINSSSFKYTININNLSEDEVNGGFTNFDPKDGLYLVDESYNVYQTKYIEGSEVKIGDGQELGTFEYQFTFQTSNLSSDRAYDFIGISFTRPLSQDDSSIVSFNQDVVIETKKSDNNLIYLWIFIGLVIILFVVIIAIMLVSLAIKKRNLKMVKALNVFTSKN